MTEVKVSMQSSSSSGLHQSPLRGAGESHNTMGVSVHTQIYIFALTMYMCRYILFTVCSYI